MKDLHNQQKIWINTIKRVFMRISELLEQSMVYPSNKGIAKLKTMLSSPILAKDAHEKILTIISSPTLIQTLDDARETDPNSDIRGKLVNHIKLEFPYIGYDDIEKDMLRDGNLEGTMSPLGHPYESAD
jgi:hypothetical protein